MVYTYTVRKHYRDTIQYFHTKYSLDNKEQQLDL
jgi:hypothetical protein